MAAGIAVSRLRQALPHSPARRRLVQMMPMLLPVLAQGGSKDPRVVYTFGDSILDCGHYNAHGVHPGQLIVRNDDRLFPAFEGRDLQSQGPAQLVHCAVDGATVAGLEAQLLALERRKDIASQARHIALLTVGGNDLLRGLASDDGPGMREFERALASFLDRLPIRPVLVGNVYDPTFGDDDRNFLGVDPALARANLRRVNEILGVFGERNGKLADLHAHFLKGDASWYTRTIEPSLTGASEVRRVFLPLVASA